MNYGTVRTMLENQEAIREQYFKTSFIGDDTIKASFAVPFNPDVVHIVAFSAYATGLKNIYQSLVIDTRAVTKWNALATYSRESTDAKGNTIISSGTTTLTTASVNGTDDDGSKVISYDKGVFTWKLNKSSLSSVIFSKHVRYYVIATRFPDKDAKAIVEEELSLLPNQVPKDATGAKVKDGIINYDKAQIEALFTTGEWDELIKDKIATTTNTDGWTFKLE